jgi:hypothetical protein
MTFHQIAQSIRNGKMTLEHQGHWGCSDVKQYEKVKTDIFERILEKYDDDLEKSKGSYDGKWSSQPNEKRAQKDIDKDMRDFYSRDLDRDYSIEFRGDLSHIRYEYTCFHCGERIFFYAPEPDKLVAFTSYKGYTNGVQKPCILPRHDPYEGTIKVDSDMIFTNYFGDGNAPHLSADTPSELETGKRDWSEEYSLNASIGRIRIADFKSKILNVAYGQMGNMSIGVYVNDTGTKIILDNPWDNEIEGFTKIGDNISLSVWRYEATDMTTLKLDNSNYDEFIKKSDERYLDIIRVPVKHGIWKFTHYYDACEDSKHYAVFELDIKK